jgi:hypothetical protein
MFNIVGGAYDPPIMPRSRKASDIKAATKQRGVLQLLDAALITFC